MTAMEYAKAYCEMDTRSKNALLASLHEVLSADDYATVAMFLGLSDWMNNPKKFYAIRQSMGEYMYGQLSRKEC